MGLEPGSQLIGKAVDYVFIGSCTNARIEDLRLVAAMVKGKKKAANVEVWVVPGSKQVEEQAKREGLDKIFEAAGFELRSPGMFCMPWNERRQSACRENQYRNLEQEF